MLLVMSVLVAMLLMTMRMTAFALTAYRITDLLDGILESILLSLGCIILDRNSLIVKTYVKILHTFLK